MRILIGTYDICGWMTGLANAFREMGHEVTTIVSEKPSQLDHEYDLRISDLAGEPLKADPAYSRMPYARLKGWLERKRREKRYLTSLRRLVDGHDLVVKMWIPFLHEATENALVKSRGKRLIQLFVGSDARYMPAFMQQYDVGRWTIPKDVQDTDLNYILANIRQAERYADTIYSVPDQAGMQLRPYRHLTVPIDPSSIRFHVPGRDVPRVVHAPSIPWKKGTDLIEAAIQALRDEGLDFEFVSLRNVPNKKLLENLSDADILVDELVCHGPGSLSFEAMLSGCAVATRYLEDSPACFRPPVVHVDADNLVQRLRELVTDKERVRKLAHEGRSYAARHNDVRAVASRMLQDLDDPDGHDYRPRFLRERYQPAHPSEAELINRWTGHVRNCDWYQRSIEPGHRSGLHF